jgi:hypothetical protein
VTDELTPEQEAAVRRLLSEARHDQPMPADVAARLDAVLDELVADEGVDDLEVFEPSVSRTGGSAVTDLAGARRRRQKAGRLLLAAAAVVVGGVAVGQTIGNTSFDGGDADSAGTALSDAPRTGDDADGGAESADREDGGGDAAAEEPVVPESTSGQAFLADVEVPLTLSSDSFAADVQRQLARTARERRQAATSNYDGLSAYGYDTNTFQCPEGPYGEGARLPAYYDAEEAVLVLRRPQAGMQRVDLLTCGTAVQLNSVTLPAP